MTQKEENKNEDIHINEEESGILEFTKRKLPTEEQMEEFEEIIEDEIREEVGGDYDIDEEDEEIEESLNEIYQDDDGKIVDVKKLSIKKGHGFFFWFFVFILFAGSLIGAGYGVSHYYFNSSNNVEEVELVVSGETEVLSSEEYFYEINYKNLSSVPLHDVRIEVKYPENYIFIESQPAPSLEKNTVWEIDTIAPFNTGKIQIRGEMVGKDGITGILLANMTYMPENFSSYFEKKGAVSTKIKGIGLEIEIDYIKSALVNDDNEIAIRINSQEKSYLNNFRVTLEPQENIEILDNSEYKDKEGIIDFETIRAGVWQINEVKSEVLELPVLIKFLDKEQDLQSLKFYFSKGIKNEQDKEESQKYYDFFEDIIEFEVMKSDLNLTVFCNGSKDDIGIDFDNYLNYSIVYNNKGEAEMKNVIIMAVLESDFIDWDTLEDSSGGKKIGNTITWTKEEIASLETIEQNQEGSIDFSVKMKGAPDSINPDLDYQVKAFSQYSVGKVDDDSDEETEDDSEEKSEIDNRSNIIVSKINSNMNFDESVRYFNEDNIPVGTGPNPPEVGKITSYKVYWKLTNNLHELRDVEIVSNLPEHVSWEDKSNVSAGTITYLKDKHAISWSINRLPITVVEATADFNISLTPKEDDKDKIMVLLGGTNIIAEDSETEERLEFETKAKTTKLEDDEIGKNSGMVE